VNTDVSLAQIKDSMINKLLKKLYQSNIYIFRKLLLCTVLLKTHLKRNNPLKIAKELNLIPNTGCRGNFNYWCKILNKKGQGIARKSLDCPLWYGSHNSFMDVKVFQQSELEPTRTELNSVHVFSSEIHCTMDPIFIPGFPCISFNSNF
jgi:hypothetical protein